MKEKDVGGKTRTLRLLVAAGALALGVTGAGALPTAVTHPVNAQESAQDFSEHPLTGTWMASTPGGPALSTFAADGSVVMGVPATAAGPQGVMFVSSEVGTWESIGERSAHFTAVQILSDAQGNLVGTVTIDGYPVVSEDGQALLDDGTQATFIMRDASGAIIEENLGSPPITAVRMAVGAPGFAEGAEASATPESDASLAAEDVIRATELERLNALVDGDAAVADELHAEDFQLINPSGGALSKAQYLGAIASGEIDYLVFEPTTPIAVRLHDDAAIVRYQSHIHIVVGGEDIDTRGWHTDLYELRDGRWQAVWSQMTEIV